MKTLRYRLGAIATVALFALTACSGDGKGDSDTAPTPKGSASASESPSEAPTLDPDKPITDVPDVQVDPKTGETNFCEKQDKPFTGPAAKKWGAKNVKAAYCQMVDLQYKNSFVSSLIREENPKKNLRLIDFSPVHEHMTPGARKAWDASIKEYLKTGERAADIWPLMYVNLNRPDVDFYPESSGEPLYYNMQVSPADAVVDTRYTPTRLALTFTIRVDLSLTKDGKPYLLPATKKVTHYLVPNNGNPDVPWLIDAWYAEVKPGKLVKNTLGTGGE